jgi:ATP-dependent protease HslVU (ClpYQ) peptidase subunit
MQSGRAMTPPGLGTTFTPSAAGQAARASVQRIGQGLVEQAGQAAGPMTIRSLLTNPQVLAGGAGALADVMGQQSQQAIARQQMEQQAQQFQQQFDVSEEERKRRQAEADRLAAMFMARS